MTDTLYKHRMGIKECKDAVELAFLSQTVPLVLGDPASAKSAMFAQLAVQYNLELVDIRLGEMDITDINGLINFVQTKGANGDLVDRCKYVPLDIFPLEDTPLPTGKDGFLLLLDEFTHADIPIQKAAFKLLHELTIGNNPLHPQTIVACAGNMSTSRSFCEPLPAALISRVCVLPVTLTQSEWSEWAVNNGIDPIITAYIQYRPDNFNTFDKPDDKEVFANSRGWEKLSRVYQNVYKSSEENKAKFENAFLDVASGLVSSAVATDFKAFTDIQIPDLSYFLSDPKNIALPTEMSHKYLLASALAGEMTSGDAQGAATLVVRLPSTLGYFAIQTAVANNPSILKIPEIKEWTKNVSSTKLAA